MVLMAHFKVTNLYWLCWKLTLKNFSILHTTPPDKHACWLGQEANTAVFAFSHPWNLGIPLCSCHCMLSIVNGGTKTETFLLQWEEQFIAKPKAVTKFPHENPKHWGMLWLTHRGKHVYEVGYLEMDKTWLHCTTLKNKCTNLSLALKWYHQWYIFCTFVWIKYTFQNNLRYIMG